MESLIMPLKTRSEWRMLPYYASFKLKGLKPVRYRSIVLPALSEEDAKLSIIRFSSLIGWEVTITEDPLPLTKGLYEGTFVCPQEIDYDLWSPLHYDNLAWRPDGAKPAMPADAPHDGRGPHVLIV